MRGLPKRLSREMREFVPILEANNYECRRSSGSHFMFVNAVSGKTLVVNTHLNKMVRHKLIRDYKLNLEVR